MIPKLIAQAADLHKLKPNWNGQGSDPPTPLAILEALALAAVIEDNTGGIQPMEFAASANDGVYALYMNGEYRHGQRYIAVEASNEGDGIGCIGELGQPGAAFSVLVEAGEYGPDGRARTMNDQAFEGIVQAIMALYT